MTDGKEKNFDTVKVFREIKEKISKDISDMPFDKFQDYVSRHSLKAYVGNAPAAEHRGKGAELRG